MDTVHSLVMIPSSKENLFDILHCSGLVQNCTGVSSIELGPILELNSSNESMRTVHDSPKRWVSAFVMWLE